MYSVVPLLMCWPHVGGSIKGQLCVCLHVVLIVLLHYVNKILGLCCSGCESGIHSGHDCSVLSDANRFKRLGTRQTAPQWSGNETNGAAIVLGTH